MALFGWLSPEHQVSWTGSGGYKAVVTTLDAENQYSPDFVKTGIYKYDRRAEDPGGNGWLLAAFCEPGYAGDTFEVRIWASATANKSSVAGDCYMLYDPIPHAWGRWKLNTDEIWATSSGSQEDPWFKCTLPTVRTSTPLSSDIYVLVFRDCPEAGSMVTVLTGITGLAGWSLRRRNIR